MKTGRADTWSRVASVLVCTALLGIGCGVVGRDSAPANESRAETPAPLPLPTPGSVLALLPPRASSAALLVHQGSDFELGQRATAQGQNAILDPQWLGNTSPFADVAFAVYRFNLEGYSGPQTLKLTWSEAPLDCFFLWLGLSRWDKARWDWRRGPASGFVDFGPHGLQPFTKTDTGDVLLAVVLLGTAPARISQTELGGTLQGDWCIGGHDAQRTGQSPFAGSQTNHVKWALNLGGDVRANPVIGADGTIYVGTFHTDEPSEFFAVNPSGTVKWSFQTEDRIEAAAAVATDGTVYVASGTVDAQGGKGKLYAVNPDGTPKWTLTTGALSSPLIDPSGVVYAAGLRGLTVNLLYAVNPDGTVRWAPVWLDDLKTPALSASGTVYVGCKDNNLYAVNPDGSQEWARASADSSVPVVSPDGTIYAACLDGNLYAVDPDSSIRWTYCVGSHAYQAAIGPDGTVYVAGGRDGLHAVGPDGTQKWTYVTDQLMRGQPTVGADGTVYATSYNPNPSGNEDDCTLLVVNPDGTLKWSFPSQELMYSPAIGADGTLYVGSGDDHLYAFGP